MGKTEPIGYMLIEKKAPFPCADMERHVPMLWTFCRALARALSIHPGCFHAHMLVLGSSPLNAVKMNYSALLGVFPNVLMILTGAPGDGKSVPLWYDTMVMHRCRRQAGGAIIRLRSAFLFGVGNWYVCSPHDLFLFLLLIGIVPRPRSLLIRAYGSCIR